MSTGFSYVYKYICFNFLLGIVTSLPTLVGPEPNSKIVFHNLCVGEVGTRDAGFQGVIGIPEVLGTYPMFY